VTASGIEEFQLMPEGLKVPIPKHLVESAIVIPIDDPEQGLTGELVLYRAPESGKAEAALADKSPVRAHDDDNYYGTRSGILLRGGFAVGPVPGLPDFILTPPSDARIAVSKDRGNPRSLPLTDLGRTRLVEDHDIAATIFRKWLSVLLDSVEDIEKRPVGCPGIHQISLLRNARWLERYDAYTLYRLARACWPWIFKDPQKARSRIVDWEEGRGEELYIGSDFGSYLFWAVFGLIMPKITTLVRGQEGNHYLSPPKQGWQEELKNWRTFISDGLNWGKFSKYTDNIKDVLCDIYTGSSFINTLYKSRFADFSEAEIDDLFRMFDKLSYAKRYERQANLPSSWLPLLERAVNVAGDLSVRSIGYQYLLRSLASDRPE
jgi:hypothetical protein